MKVGKQLLQHETPLYTGLKKHAGKNPIQFHIPGHKKGSGMDPEFRAFIGENALSIDLINIEPLDDLHAPKGIIKQAQDLAAEAFGADYTFFRSGNERRYHDDGHGRMRTRRQNHRAEKCS